jgi:hypothetical protein
MVSSLVPWSLDFDPAQGQIGDCSLQMNVASWMDLAEITALAGHMMFLEDTPDVLDPDRPEEDHGEVIQGIYASDCNSIDQARLTEGRDE